MGVEKAKHQIKRKKATSTSGSSKKLSLEDHMSMLQEYIKVTSNLYYCCRYEHLDDLC